MQRKASVLLSIIILVILAPPVFSQLEEEVRVDLIEVWAKVTDKNNRLVTDLSPDDFSIFIDGKKMELRCFDRIFQGAPAASESTELQADNEKSSTEKHKFIFFFDLLHTSARDIDFLKTRIVDFLSNSFHEEQDQGMVFVLLPSLHLGVVQKMTESKDALIDVIAKMRGNPTQEARIRNNERELLEVLYAFGSVPENPNGTISQGANSRSIETIRQARGLARTYATQERNLSKITMNAFLSIADYLADNTYEGRLVMIYVSGGFSMRPGQNYFEIVDKAIENNFTIGTDDLVFRDMPSNDFELEVRDTIGLLNRLNVTIYSIDANGLLENNQGAERDSRATRIGINTVSYSQELQDSLAMISRETGGLAFLNSQNFSKGLGDMVNDMNQQYWLCSTLPPFKKRGTYHKIDVKVARSGLNVRHRQGYVE